MKDIQQLIKKNNQEGRYNDIYPVTFTNAVLDRETNELLNEILTRFNFIYLPYTGNAANTRLLVPMKYRRKGLWIAYVRTDNTLVVEYYTATAVNDDSWSSNTNWAAYNIAEIDSRMLEPDDLSMELGKLSFADRPVNPANYLSKGYKILRRNIITLPDTTKINFLSQDMISLSNTSYEIRYDYDLNGGTIEIPIGCTLDFKGGSIKNGTIVFNYTTLKCKNSPIFDNVNISGTISSDLYLSMWKIGDTVDAAPIIEKALYTIQTTNHRFNIDANCYMSSYASVPSNSDLYINHDVTITSSGDGGFTLMNRDTSVYKYSGASNIIVHGGGVFDFNSRNTNSPTNSAFTIYHCSNVIIDGITFKDPASYHVIEIGGSEHITVKNCKFFGFRPIATSALPAASIKGECIQIEHTSDGNGGIPVPYFDKTECKDIIIKDNLFDGLYTFDSDGNKVYSTYMWRPIGCHEDQVGATEFVYHDGLLVEGNTFNSVRQVCVTPRYINNCSIINNTATDLQGIFVSGLPVGKSYYNVPFDFNNVKISGNIVRFDNTVTSNTLVSSIYTVGRNNWGAIDLIGTTGSIITDNEIYDAPNSSIILDCCPNTLILNNKFHGWNTIDKNKGAASNNRAAIDIMDSTPEPDNKQVKEVTKNVSMSGNLFVDDWTSFPIRPFTRNKADIENSWNIIDNVFNIANPAWRFVPPTTVNALDLSSFGSALVGNHPVWNKGFKGKSFTRDTDGRNIYFDGTTWLNEDGTLIAKVAMVSSIDQISSPSTIYKITHDINLGGATINIPSNCTLDFQGGSFSNGTLNGNNTDITTDKQTRLFNNITIAGTWKVANIYDSWFDFIPNIEFDNRVNLQNLCNLTSDNFKSTIYISPATYYLSIPTNGGTGIYLNSNTTLILSGTLKLISNNFTHYQIINIVDKSNIVIKGDGIIEGDVETHTGTTGEWGMGINIISSSNIVIKDVSVLKCWGDNIYIGQKTVSSTDFGESILIDNVISRYGRRQGLSVITAKDLTISNSTFTDTGSIKHTAPGAGINIEPNSSDATLKNISISNCYFENNQRNNVDLLFVNVNPTSNIRVSGCTCKGNIRFATVSNNILIASSYINNVVVLSGVIHNNVNIIGCTINSPADNIMGQNFTVTFNNCNFTSGLGNSKSFILATTTDSPAFKISLPNSDCLYKITIITGHNAINAYYAIEFFFKGRSASNNVLKKAGMNIYQGNYGNGETNLQDFYNYGIVASNPIPEESFWSIYFKQPKDMRVEGTVIVETIINNSRAGESNLLNQLKTSIVKIDDIPSTVYTNIINTPCYGSRDNINSFMVPVKGSMVYDTGINKPIFGNGSAWIDATGAVV